MTEKELYDNYEFKLVKRALMNEYPWIKDVFVDPEQLKKYSLIFLNFEIDLIKLSEEMGWPISPFIMRALKNDNEYRALYLSLFFDEIDYADTVNITSGLERVMRSIGRSPALPDELKIKNKGPFSVGDFYINKGNPPMN